MNVPEQLKYTKDHEWVQHEGDVYVIGITDHAQEQLGDVVFVDLPAVGTIISKGATFGTVESVKAVSDLFAPISGDVVAVNENLTSNPETVNSDPYSGAWMIKVKSTDAGAIEELLDAVAYKKILESA